MLVIPAVGAQTDKEIGVELFEFRRLDRSEIGVDKDLHIGITLAELFGNDVAETEIAGGINAAFVFVGVIHGALFGRIAPAAAVIHAHGDHGGFRMRFHIVEHPFDNEILKLLIADIDHAAGGVVGLFKLLPFAVNEREKLRMFGKIFIVDPVVEGVSGMFDIVTAADKFIAVKGIFFHVERPEVESVDRLPVEEIRVKPFVGKSGKSAQFKSGIVEPGGIFKLKFFSGSTVFDRAHPAVISGLFFQKIVGGINGGTFDITDEVDFSALDDDSVTVIFQFGLREMLFENRSKRFIR